MAKGKKDKNEQVIVAFFASKDLGDDAVLWLKSWDAYEEKVKLGSIGTIVKQDGKIKTHIGRKTGKGAKVGTVIGIIAAILSGGLTLVGGVVVGSATGGVVGAFLKKSTHLTKAEIEEIGKELDAGRVAVVVTCDEDEVTPTRRLLIDMGGQVRNYTVPEEAYTEAAKAVPGADAAAVAESPAEVVSAALAAASDVPDQAEMTELSANSQFIKEQNHGER